MRKKEMKALKFLAPKKFQYIDIEVPHIDDDQMLVKVEAVGICHSDVVAYNGRHPFRIPPVITGHEFSGKVVTVGKNSGKAFKVGDRVAVEPHIGCGKCYYCKSGMYNLCVDKRLVGVKDWVGCFAEFVAVYPSMCVAMPDAMSSAEGALIEPYCVGNHAVELAGLPAGSSAAVLGCGTIGMMTIVSLVNHGAGRIIGSDVSDFKGEFAKKQGASFAFNPVKDDVTAEIMRITDGVGVDAVFVDVAVPNILDQAFKICRKAGRIIIVALFDEPVPVDLKHIQLGQRYVIGTNMYTHEDYLQTMRQYQTGKLKLSGLVTKKIDFAAAGDMIHAMSEGKNNDEIKVIIDFSL